MPKVSRTPLKTEESRRIRDAFLKTLALLHTTEEVEEFLEDFLTLAEWKMFMKRLAIAEMLIGGKSYATIQESLKVGTDTIARMQTFLQIHGAGMRRMIKQLQKR